MTASGRIRKRKHKSHTSGDVPSPTASPTAAMAPEKGEETVVEEAALSGDYNNFTHNFVDLQNLLSFNELNGSSPSSASSAITLSNGAIRDTLLGTVLTTATATVAPAASSLIATLVSSTTASARVAVPGRGLAIADATSSTYYANLLNLSPATTSLISAAAATKSYNDSALRWEQLDGSVDFGFDPLYRHSLAMSMVYCVAYIVVFLVGLVGNSFVIAVVLRAPRMRTVTNYFIVNLVGGP
ncbi:hypothetical protein M5D96_002262 [Drosophila gunungcola]|uniref:G-protein coupled receptors family 1 profile domain-containing protein n=1 Tax=Drosophila gunungcola TaxID=103775 RepID=A0A9P9YZN9_9MUSC|nr:hypothetical protein M5D96_002262 [Drosophila gunungcola]